MLYIQDKNKGSAVDLKIVLFNNMSTSRVIHTRRGKRQTDDMDAFACRLKIRNRERLSLSFSRQPNGKRRKSTRIFTSEKQNLSCCLLACCQNGSIVFYGAERIT